MSIDLVLAVLFILAGATLVVSAAWTLDSAYSSRRWPRASGTAPAAVVSRVVAV